METASPGMQVCPFCGKVFKRLKAHLPHCKMTRNVNSKSNSKKTEEPIAIPQLESNCKLVRTRASPNQKIKVKENSARTLTQKEKAASTKKQNNSRGLGNEQCTSEQTVWSRGINEPQAIQGDLMDNRELIRKKISQQSVGRITKGRPKEAKKEMAIKTKASEHFLKQDQDKVDVNQEIVKFKGTTRTKVNSTQKIANNNSIKKERENIEDSSPRPPLNGKGSADLIPKNIFCPKVKTILNLEHIQTRPEFEETTAVLDLQANAIIPQSSGTVRSNSLHSIRQENVVPKVDIRCQSDQNEVTEGIAPNKLMYEQSSISNIKTSVWHHIKENLCRRTTTTTKQDFISKMNTNVKEGGYRADILETSHSTAVCDSSTSNHICSRITASMRVKDLNKFEGNPQIGYVANMKKAESSDLHTNGVAQSEYLHLSQKEKCWNKDVFLSMSSTKTEYLDERIKKLHPRKTGVGMEWFPELYPGYHSIGLRMLPEQTKQWETPIRLSVSQSESTKGYNRYYNKYMNSRKGVVGGVITLFVGYATLSYIWNYDCIKHNFWRKYH
ncbi:mitochondrial nucleoid-associated protein 1-like isoform X2 [Heptranchias perlo]|uniref:mitochondrial nucleoid-associated protein 1-like isoform X2 n=1 Tax=Heptranchias perlo TaxID=212740 RepID=UPI0035599EEF